MKAHVGGDAESRVTHSLETSTARVHHSRIWEELLHGKEASACTRVQTRIVTLAGHSLIFCASKDRKAMAANLRRICSAATADLAATELDPFAKTWAGKHASITTAWRRAWQEAIPFFGLDPATRKIFGKTLPWQA